MGREKGLAHKRKTETPGRDFRNSTGWMEDEDLQDSQRYKEACELIENIVTQALGGNEDAKVKLGRIFVEAQKVNDFAARNLTSILGTLEVAELIVKDEKALTTEIRLMPEAEKERRRQIREFVWRDSKSFSLAA